MVVVTAAEPLAMTETLEIHRALEAMELATAAVVCNRIAPAAFEAADVARMLRRCMREPSFKQPGLLAEIARGELKRSDHERRSLDILQRQIQAPVITLEERHGFSGSALAAELSKELAARLAQ